MIHVLQKKQVRHWEFSLSLALNPGLPMLIMIMIQVVLFLCTQLRLLSMAPLHPLCRQYVSVPSACMVLCLIVLVLPASSVWGIPSHPSRPSSEATSSGKPYCANSAKWTLSKPPDPLVILPLKHLFHSSRANCKQTRKPKFREVI